MNWQYSPYLLPLLLSVGASAVLFVMAWRRRHTPGAIFLAFLMVGAMIWSVTAMMEQASADLAGKIFWSKLTYAGIGLSIIAWPTFVFYSTGRDKWISRRVLLALSIEPAVVFILVWTNEAHRLIWTAERLVSTSGITVMDVDHGAAFWVHAVYAYLVLLFSTILLVRFYVRSPHLYRRQAIALFTAIVVPWIGNAAFLANLSLVDLTPVTFTLTGVAIAWGLLRFRLLDIVPIARDAVVESIIEGVFVLDHRNRLVDLNAAAMKLVGGAEKTHIGRPLETVLPALTQILQQNPDEDQMLEVTLPVGAEQRNFELRITPLRSRTQRLTGRVMITHDVTERKQAAQRIQTQNEALAQANRELEAARRQAEEATNLKSQFLATMSHELRTPLNAILGYTELQLAGMAGEFSDEQKNYQKRVLTNAEHLLKLINEILDLARIEAGRTEIIRKPFELQPWLSQIVQQTQGLADSKGLNFEHKLDERLPATLIGDPSRLTQVAINLLGNAFKFTETGSVKIHIRKSGIDNWMIEVTDTGVGIPPHMQEVVFEEFRQVDGTFKRPHGGTGLGLAIVRKLVMLMGGRIRLASEMGEGSTFTVYLPLIEEKPAAVAESAPVALEAKPVP